MYPPAAAANFTTQLTGHAFNATTKQLCPADTAWPVHVKASGKFADVVPAILKYSVAYAGLNSLDFADAFLSAETAPPLGH